MILERAARCFDIQVGSSPRGAPVKSLAAILKDFAGPSERGEAAFRQGEFALLVVGVRFNKAETRAIVLFHFEQSGAPRVSAHLVIDLTARAANTYAAILEDAPGLTKAVLEHALAAFAQRWCGFYAMGPGGKFSEVRSRFGFVGEAPETFTVAGDPAVCEAEIVPEVSAKLDAVLRSRRAQRAA